MTRSDQIIDMFGPFAVEKVRRRQTAVTADDGTCNSCHSAQVTNIASGHLGLVTTTATANIPAGTKDTTPSWL